jgi:hypothetical protein
MFLQNDCQPSTDYTALYPENRTIHDDCCEIIKSYLISDCLNHDNVAVHLFKSKPYSIPSAKLEDLTKICPFSDGSAL